LSVKQYTVIVIRKDQLIYIEDIRGGALSNSLKKKFDQLLEEGDRLLFTNIEIKTDIHLDPAVNSIEIRIKG